MLRHLLQYAANPCAIEAVPQSTVQPADSPPGQESKQLLNGQMIDTTQVMCCCCMGRGLTSPEEGISTAGAKTELVGMTFSPAPDGGMLPEYGAQMAAHSRAKMTAP